ncbi:glycosyltransferase family 4 protein [Rhizobium alvei]|uniref:Glycosyltransferase family 4 protein n=1 Tax=Rhizobium alvei TaxID=1132659 RepID=A0ABT8YJB6_9HYPH|nr:glycosyltransferase family 4 protein [Rhizobium alvei]MDO6963793.1 glycosyltransferase family 4 protein [Rhizobium alvei]
MADDRPLRILHCFRSPVGGIFRHVRDLAVEQSRAGHSVGILCDSSTGGAHEDKLFQSIMPHLKLGLTRMPIDRSISLRDAPVFWRGYKEIRSLRPDVLHGHGAKGGAMARLAGTALRVNRYRVSRLYSPHGGSLHFSPNALSGKAVFWLEWMQMALSDALVFVCAFERNTFAAKVGRIRVRNEVIYNGVGEADFEPLQTDPEAVDFLYVGMLRDLKGPDVFIEAFAKTERRLGRPLRGMMIGDGPQEQKYLDMMTRLGLGRRISMFPAMNIRDAFQLTRAVVVPSRAESMPYIVLEALAARKTVIASDVGGISEVLGSDSQALVPAGDSDRMSKAMADSMTEPGWAAANLPEPGHFHDRFSAVTMARRITALYQETLAKG